MTTASASTTRIEEALTTTPMPRQMMMPRRVTMTDHALRAIGAWLAATGLLPADMTRARKAAIDIVTG